MTVPAGASHVLELPAKMAYDGSHRHHTQLRRFIMLKMIAAAIVGGLAVWLYGEEIKRLAATRTERMRERAADTLHAVQGKAEEVLDATREQVTSTLRAGEQALRPAPQHQG